MEVFSAKKLRVGMANSGDPMNTARIFMRVF
jgi:hypothetical protein